MANWREKVKHSSQVKVNYAIVEGWNKHHWMSSSRENQDIRGSLFFNRERVWLDVNAAFKTTDVFSTTNFKLFLMSTLRNITTNKMVYREYNTE